MSERTTTRPVHHFEAEFGIGEAVYLRVRTEKVPGLVVGVHFYPGFAIYNVTWGDGHNNLGMYYALELAREFVPDYERD